MGSVGQKGGKIYEMPKQVRHDIQEAGRYTDVNTPPTTKASMVLTLTRRSRVPLSPQGRGEKRQRRGKEEEKSCGRRGYLREGKNRPPHTHPQRKPHNFHPHPTPTRPPLPSREREFLSYRTYTKLSPSPHTKLSCRINIKLSC